MSENFEEIIEDNGNDTLKEINKETIIFEPKSLSLITINQNITSKNIDSCVKSIQIKYRDCYSMTLCHVDTINTSNDHLSESSNDINKSLRNIVTNYNNSYVLDILARVIAIEEKDSDTNELISCSFTYKRLNEEYTWKVFLTSQEGYEELKILDFLLGQYTYYDNMKILQQTEKMIDIDGNIPTLTTQKSSNIVATGFEGTGSLIRTTLTTSGKLTGYAIRSLGKLYTNTAVQSRKLFNVDLRKETTETVANESAIQSNKVNENHINAAMKNKERAEIIHAGAKRITGAALYPVRWTGRKASEWASQGNTNLDLSVTESSKKSTIFQGLGTSASSDNGPNRKDVISNVTMDTLGGIGNAVVSICKGVTEAIGEVGTAIGDSALHHSKTINGDEYANEVTKHYVSAASELGLASYKVMNVMALGIGGVLADAAVEGTTLLICLSDFLIGPIVLQGYCEMIQLPQLTPRIFFVVLRPWSIAFYHSSKDVMNRPYKIVITAMLDTLPQLRYYENINRIEKPMDDMLYHSYSNTQAYETIDNPMIIDNATDDKVDESKYHETDNNQSTNQFNLVNKWLFNQRPHIEFCTVDCSTFLIFPILIESTNEILKYSIDLLEWYNELKQASFRVETIGKKKSGAEDIALERRLSLLPKDNILSINFKFIILDYEISNHKLDKHIDKEVDGNFNLTSKVTSNVESSNVIDESDYVIIQDKIDIDSPIDESLDEGIDMNSIDNQTLNNDTNNPTNDKSTNTSTVKSNNSFKDLINQSISNLILNPFRKIALNSLRVRIVPLTDKGLYVRGECHVTDFSPISAIPPLESSKEPEVVDNESKGLHEILYTLYDKTTVCRLRDQRCQIVNWRDKEQLFEIGKQFSLSLVDIKYLIVTVQGKTVFGSTIEVGRGRISISSLSNSPSNIWVPLTHLSTKQHVGYILINLQMKPFL